MLEFQSHNGAIAAGGAVVGWVSPKQVSIPQWCDCCLPLLPSMVIVSNAFQSHNGAIAADKRTFFRRRQRLFQSHNGAIAAYVASHRVGSFKVVSIPQWCDCC